MFWWPTSELPIWPSGRPTARPDVLTAVCGQFRASLSIFGVRARAMALPSFLGLMPQPSLMPRKHGRGRLEGIVLIRISTPFILLDATVLRNVRAFIVA